MLGTLRQTVLRLLYAALLFVCVGWLPFWVNAAPAIAIPPTSSQVLILIDEGSHELETGEFESAIAHLTDAISQDSRQPQAYALRAYAKRQLGQFQSALDDYSAILELQPRSATTYVDRGLLKGMLGDAKGAIADHTRAIDIEPNNARAYSSRGIARCVSGEIEAGQQDFRQSGVLSLNQGDYQLYSIASRSEKKFCR
ncbi:MAG: tetratricopeptide repeat protein [Synechococcus sp.]